MNNNEQWGNIELPGLSDEKLYNTSWNRVAAGKENANNPKLLALAQSKKNNPEYSKITKEAAQRRAENPENYQALLHGVRNVRDNTYQAEVNRRPEKRALHSQLQKGKVVTQQTRDKLRSIKTNKPGDAHWEAAHQAGLARRDKPFHAGEYGVFPSLTAAGRYVMEQGLLKNAIKKFEKWKKTDPTNYYFIKDEK